MGGEDRGRIGRTHEGLSIRGKLNLGCGERDIRPGYVNIDIREIEGAVRRDVGDRESMTAFSNAAEILAFDIIEHFPREKAMGVLELWVDLLAPGGILKVRCPDILHAVSVRFDDEWLELLLYGSQDYEENYHRCGFTRPMMERILRDLGLEIEASWNTDAGNLEIWARK